MDETRRCNSSTVTLMGNFAYPPGKVYSTVQRWASLMTDSSMPVEFIGDMPLRTRLKPRVSEGLPSEPSTEVCFIPCVIRGMSHRLINYGTSAGYVEAVVAVSGSY